MGGATQVRARVSGHVLSAPGSRTALTRPSPLVWGAVRSLKDRSRPRPLTRLGENDAGGTAPVTFSVTARVPATPDLLRAAAARSGTSGFPARRSSERAQILLSGPAGEGCQHAAGRELMKSSRNNHLALKQEQASCAFSSDG